MSERPPLPKESTREGSGSELSLAERAERAMFKLQGAKEMDRLMEVSHQEADEFINEKNIGAGPHDKLSGKYKIDEKFQRLINHLDTDRMEDGNALIAALDESAVKWFKDLAEDLGEKPIYKSLLSSQIRSLQRIAREADELIEFRRGGWELQVEKTLQALKRVREWKDQEEVFSIIEVTHHKQTDKAIRNLVARAKKIPAIYAELIRRYSAKFEALGVDLEMPF
jgi:hypothetical protein